MSIEKVKQYFATMGMEQRVLEFDVSSATVELAAEALGVRPARIAKTLSFHMGEGCQLIVTAGDAKIDNGKYKARFGSKARMLSFEEVEPMTGSAVGGVCPFALPGHVPVYLDASLKRFYTVFPACGSDNSAIELDCQELYRYAGAVDWVDVCKDWDPVAEPTYRAALFEDVASFTDGEIVLRLKQATDADEKTGWVPAYGFEIRRCVDDALAGAIDLRIGFTRNTFFGGNIGYKVEEPFRGHGYAAKAVKLVLPLAKRHGMPCVRIACALENMPSRVTAEGVGATLEKEVEIPSYASLYREGVRGVHRIYRIDLINQ